MKKIVLFIVLCLVPFVLIGQSTNVRSVVIDNDLIFYRGQTSLNTGTGIVLKSVDQTDMRNSAWWLANTSYEIRDSINLGGVTVTLPVNVTLKFNGGLLANGMITGNHASFVNPAQRKIFDTTLVCKGTWQTTVITPQDYGAISVDSNNIFTHDCSPSFRACLGSIFTVNIPSGNYYLHTTVYATLPKIVKAGERSVVDYPTTGSGNSYDYSPYQVRIFSDQNIDYIVVQIGRFYWLGGTFDSQQIAHHTKCFFRYDFEGHDMWGGELSFSGVGNKTALREDQAGTTAVWFNQSVVVGGTDGGYACDIDINTAGGQWTYLAYGIRIDEDVNGPNYTFVNSLRSNVSMDGVIHGFYILDGTDNVWRGLYQTRNILSLANRYTPFMYLGPETSYNLVDVMLWDLSGTLNAGYYNNYLGLRNDGKSNQLSQRMLYNSRGGIAISSQGRFVVDTVMFGEGSILIPQTNAHGATRPVYPIQIGMMHYDTFLEKPMWWNGKWWVDATGKSYTDGAYRSAGTYLSDGLSAYWKFDEEAGATVFDETANDNDGTVVGALINQTGILGKCLYFDGTDSVTIVNSASLRMNATNFSITAWVKFTGTAEGAVVGGNVERSPSLSIDNDEYLHARSYLKADLNTSSVPGLVTKDQWMFIAAVIDSTDSYLSHLYINGKMMKYDDFSVSDFLSSSFINRIGMGGRGHFPFTGYIDEVGIWKRKLSIDEILKLYNHGTPFLYSSFASYYILN